MRKLLLERKLLQMLQELRQMLLLRQKPQLVLELLLGLLLEQMLVQELLQMRMLLERMLQELFSRRKQPESMPTGKRARVIFSCLYFQ